jgi:hypothetical protein
VEVLDIGGDGTQNGTASAGSCDYDIALPTSDVESAIHITTAGVAHPKLIKRHYREQKVEDTASLERAGAEPPVDHGDSFDADACYAEPSTNQVASFTCRSGPLLFEVWGQTFATFEGVPEDQSERHWQDRVLPEVIRTVAAKTRAS